MGGLSAPSGSWTGPVAGLGREPGPLRDSVRVGLCWVIDRRLVLLLGLIAASPIIVSTVRAVLAGWTPVWDDAIVATRSFDVLSAHSPLVGEHSDASLSSVGPVFGAGPMLYWLLAFQAHFLGDWALPVTMGLVNTASIMAVVALARRRGGTAFMFVIAAGLAAMCRSLPQEALHSVDNSNAGLLPFTLLIFLAWSVACGEYRLLPLTVLVASFVVQTHFSWGLASLAVLIVAIAGLAVSVTKRRGPASASIRGAKRWVLGASGVALVCWSAPLLNQAIHRPGNLVRIVQTATAHQRAVGLTPAWHALVRTIGIPPWWLRTPTTQHVAGRFYDLTRAPSDPAIASCVLILAWLSMMVVLGLRRRRTDVVAAVALALALDGAVVVFTASTPARLVFSLDYGLRWASPVGMFTWLVLGWSLAALVPPSRWPAVQRLRTLVTVKQPGFARLAGLSITAIVAVLVTIHAGSDQRRWTYRPVRDIASRLNTLIPHQYTVLVSGSSLVGIELQTAIIYQLRRSGYRVLADKNLDLPVRLGPSYSSDRRHDDVLFVEDRSTPIRRDARAIVSVPVNTHLTTGGEPRPSAIVVSLLSSRSP
jgi:hypothetical protein